MESKKEVWGMGAEMGLGIEDSYYCKLLPVRAPLGCVSQGTSAMRGPGRKSISHQGVGPPLSTPSILYPKLTEAQISV